MHTSYLMPTYARQPISFARGQGSWLYTQDNTAYLDALTGIAVCGLGHCHPQITQAIQEQAGILIHTSNLFGIDWQEKAGEILCQTAQMDSVFFANSGAEANEAALKLARMYAHQKGYARVKVIVMENAFHGRTLLTVSATANLKAREGFYTLDEEFIRVPFGDLEAIKKVASEHTDICAILLEPIQGEGGLHVAETGFDYLEAVQKLCDQHEWLFMLDEVQTGNGRTGKPFAYQHSRAKPDVLTTAKGLGNGFPVGACMVSGRANGLFSYGSHGSTYGGTPLACRVVHQVYQLLNEEIMQNAITQAQFIRDTLQNELGNTISTRGMGMMFGIVLPENQNYSQIVDIARDQHKLIINLTAKHVIRLLPPLNLKLNESEQIIEKLIATIKPFIT